MELLWQFLAYQFYVNGLYDPENESCYDKVSEIFEKLSGIEVTKEGLLQTRLCHSDDNYIDGDVPPEYDTQVFIHETFNAHGKNAPEILALVPKLKAREDCQSYMQKIEQWLL